MYYNLIENLQKSGVTILFSLVMIPATLNGDMIMELFELFPIKILNLANDFYVVEEQDLFKTSKTLKIKELYSIKELRVYQSQEMDFRKLLRKGSRRQNLRGVKINAVGAVIL